VGFSPFIIERRTEDNLSQHIRGAARWNKVNDKEGYFVYDTLSQTYKEVEYESITRQWYFIAKDTRSRNWIAIQPVPQSLQLGRESICHSTVQAADVDNDSSQEHKTQPSQLKKFLNLGMTMQTGTSMAAAALTLANTTTPTTTPIFRGFGSKVQGSKGGVLRFAKRGPTWTRIVWMQPWMTQLWSSDTRYSNTRSPLYVRRRRSTSTNMDK
jgi:hypothetical protein